MKSVALTGASGFVGANLARKLLAEGHEVHLLLRENSNRWRIDGIAGEVRTVEVDLCDQDAVDRVIGSIKPDWVFHLATYGAYPAQSELRRIARTNIDGTVNLLEASVKAGVEVFVNTGSSSEYGYKDHPPAETELLEPNSHYVWTKAAATHYCRHMATTCDTHLPTLRLYSVYGPYEQPGRLMPTLVARGVQGELPPLVGPRTSRDFVYVDDVCDAYLRAAATPTDERGPVFNVGSGHRTTLADVVDIVRRHFDLAAEPEWGAMKQRSWDTDVWVSDNRKIVSELGWKPEHGLEQGFELFVRWFEEHPDLADRYV